MASVDEVNVEKKFRNVSNTQESIQSLTLWVLHHKAHHEKIVDIWFRVLKKSKMQQRLIMFYLCNDIVQTCKRKHAVTYKDAFKEILKDAVLLVRDATVRNNVERILTIWEERGIYDKEFLEELEAILNNTKVRATMNSRLLAEFKPNAMMLLINKFKRFESEVELKRRQLSSLRMDASSIEAVKQLKDRTHGKEFCQQFEDSCTKIEDYVATVEREIKDRTTLVEMLDQSELFYDAQYGEAKIVANAYKNFGSRVNNLRKKLDEHQRALPDSMSPPPSPSMDAPSPGDTPPQEDAAGDDNIEMVDMEMSDEEGMLAMDEITGHGQRDTTLTTRSYPKPITSVTQIQMKPSQKRHGNKGAASLLPPPVSRDDGFGAMAANSSFMDLVQGGGLSALMQNSPSSGSDSGPGLSATGLWKAMQSSSESTTSPATTHSSVTSPMTGGTSVRGVQLGNIVTLTEGGGSTPVKDEGSSTPVQDEPEAAASSNSNPIDFLTQLISQSRKQGGASSAFFQNLSVLANTVKQSVEKDEDPEDAVVPAPKPSNDGEQKEFTDAWSSWKGESAPDQRFPPPAPSETRYNAMPPPRDHQTYPPVMPQESAPATAGMDQPATPVRMETSVPQSAPPPPPMPYDTTALVTGIQGNELPPPHLYGAPPYAPPPPPPPGMLDPNQPPPPPPMVQPQYHPPAFFQPPPHGPQPITPPSPQMPHGIPPVGVPLPPMHGTPSTPPTPADHTSPLMPPVWGQFLAPSSQPQTSPQPAPMFPHQGPVPDYQPSDSSDSQNHPGFSPQRPNLSTSTPKSILRSTPMRPNFSNLSVLREVPPNVSDSANSDEHASGEESTIPTLVGPGRPTQPAPPTHPPTLPPPRPHSQPPNTKSGGSPRSSVVSNSPSSDGQDQKDFIEKLKRRSSSSGSSSFPPAPKSILKGGGNTNLRTLTESEETEAMKSNSENGKASASCLLPTPPDKSANMDPEDMDLEKSDESPSPQAPRERTPHTSPSKNSKHEDRFDKPDRRSSGDHDFEHRNKPHWREEREDRVHLDHIPPPPRPPMPPPFGMRDPYGPPLPPFPRREDAYYDSHRPSSRGGNQRDNSSHGRFPPKRPPPYERGYYPPRW